MSNGIDNSSISERKIASCPSIWWIWTRMMSKDRRDLIKMSYLLFVIFSTEWSWYLGIVSSSPDSMIRKFITLTRALTAFTKSLTCLWVPPPQLCVTIKIVGNADPRNKEAVAANWTNAWISRWLRRNSLRLSWFTGCLNMALKLRYKRTFNPLFTNLCNSEARN